MAVRMHQHPGGLLLPRSRALTPIAQLLRRLPEDSAAGPVIADPESGWTKLRDRIVSDISEQNVILPQQLKSMLGGIQSLKWLNVAEYEGSAAQPESINGNDPNRSPGASKSWMAKAS